MKYTDKELELIKNLDIWEVNFIKALAIKMPTLKYIGGYIDSETPVLLKCELCGEITRRSPQMVRGKRSAKFKCLGCAKLKKQKEKEIRINESKINELYRNYYKQRRTEIDSLYKELKGKTVYIKKCVKCDAEYIENTKSKYCARCRHDISTKHSRKSLRELYKRDNGICYICGNKCDYEDYIYRGNTFIAGNYYPSIDHIIPLNKGGTDDWDNLKLAHRICNCKKHTKVLQGGEEQLSIPL